MTAPELADDPATRADCAAQIILTRTLRDEADERCDLTTVDTLTARLDHLLEVWTHLPAQRVGG